MEKFDSSVFEKINFYVYRLIDPRNGETFYVGKGKDNRVFDHINFDRKSKIERKELFKNDDDLSLKIQTIRAIEKAQLKVIHIIHRHGMIEKIALEVEAALIDAYPSTTNIIGGVGNEFGPMNSKEIIHKYTAEEANFGDDKVIMITINKTFPLRSLYSATQLAWKLNKENAQKAKYVLSVQNGIIVGVFKADRWLEATKANFPILEEDIPGRFGFTGKEASEEEKAKYINKRIPKKYRKRGASNPIKYKIDW